MATVVTLENIPSASPIDTAVQTLDQTKLRLIDVESSTDGRVRKASYVYADGVSNIDTLVVATRTISKDGTYRHSISLQTIQKVVVDSVLVEEAPIEVVIVWNTPGQMEDTDLVLAMVGTAYSLTHDGVTTKVPNSGVIDLMNRGIVGSLYS
jgi:hypothetical protein